MVRHWKELNKNLFAALKLEKIVMGLILSLIVMVASLNIIGPDLGCSQGREFPFEGDWFFSADLFDLYAREPHHWVGWNRVGYDIGTLWLLGFGRISISLNTDVYYLDTLPVVIEPMTVAFVSQQVIYFSNDLSGHDCCKMNPVEGLRYE